MILLHGALGSDAQFRNFQNSLTDSQEVHLLNLPGHGGTTTDDDFSIPAFACFVQNYIAAKGLEKPAVFGYSMGGYVALYVAKTAPGLLGAVGTLATKFHWDEAAAAKEVQLLNSETIEAKVPRFAAELAARHQPADWKTVVRQTAGLLEGLGKDNLLTNADYAAIAIPVLVMLGDRDKMVSLDETVAVAKSLPSGQLAVLPSTPHPWEGVDATLVAYLLQRLANQ